MSADAGTDIGIEVVYAEPARQELIALIVPRGTTAGEALSRSGLQARFPHVAFDSCALGVWGKPVDRQQQLRDGDRLEVYRPLAMDPREARRQLAAHGRAMGQKDGDAD